MDEKKWRAGTGPLARVGGEGVNMQQKNNTTHS
jgi:hypothetical protein